MPWVEVGPVSAFPLHSLKPVAVHGEQLVVAHTEHGWVCFRDECSHQPIPLSEFGEIIGDKLICHAHGAVFSLNGGGKPLCFPAVDSLSAYSIKIDGDIIYILINL